MSNLKIPLTPKECDVSNFPFMPLDIDRLFNSETWILGDDSEKVASMTLWLKSWSQIPAASIPNNDKMLAHLSGMGSKWKKVKEHALRGWVDGGEGRLYHPVVAEKALEAWIEKLASAISGAQGNAKRWDIQIDTSELQNQLCDAVYRLKSIAPQSKALTKKIAKIVESRSGGDSHHNPVGIATDKTQNRIDNINTHILAENENSQPEQPWQPDPKILLNVIRQSVGVQAEQVIAMPEYEFCLGNFNAYWENKIDLTDSQRTYKFATWLVQEFKKPAQTKTKTEKPKQTGLNVNDAWANQPRSDDQPFHGTVEIPEGFR
ncbi:YdaU family protein [Acinetobacter modestus]|uniref:DUF1376 domain-containing protein n=1 Tax=Acinetobacter modestus TaxID=1776740 RepID=UPI002030AF2E|nr:DUF1376 domain-containing protein [Acinetobacter modestus]MCM1958018.1 YdaU family protein [Acinetobacter modestus]